VTAGFLTPLDVQEVTDNTWALTRPLSYVSEVAQRTFIIPRGFVTDFASVPRVPVAFWLTGDTEHEPATVHDYLYQTHAVMKAVADDVFYEACLVIGSPRWRAWLMYQAVKRFGQSAYDSGPTRFMVMNRRLL
jgi:hypothetical protein